MDETYILARGKWKYLYRAVDKAGDIIDFLLRAERDKAAARRFFDKAIDCKPNFPVRREAALRPDAALRRGLASI